ncbi:helix-turn-helix domain-containing protein [Parasalinivibrio latis]|uniref:sugar diacid recognition domain-containing protein n=1 Tax=Parasalinivibrio latis TaxID=2952610 RepID=UPI0030E35692
MTPPMQIDARLAQQIVLRAQKIINYAINVMDTAGYIIASSNPARLQQKHEGAIVALSAGRTVEITGAMSKEMSGVKPGVNLPIFFHDEVIGIIGISGEPEDIRQYGELVRMAAEMTVEHAYLLERVSWNQQSRQELLLQWIDTSAEPEHLKALAVRLQKDIDQPQGIALCRFDASCDPKQLLDRLDHKSGEWLFARLDPQTLVIAIPLSGKTPSTLSTRWEQQQQILEKLLLVDGKATHIAYSPAGNFTVPGQFAAAQGALAAGLKLNPKSRVYYYDNLQLASLLLCPNLDWQQREVNRILSQLHERGPDLLATARIWFSNDCNSELAAKQLAIHPNSLRYRLNRVEEICQINLANFQHRALLYGCVILAFPPS